MARASSPTHLRTLTTLVAVLAVIGAPVGLVLAGVLAVRDEAHRRRWIALAGVAALVVVVAYVPLLLLSEPRLDSVVGS